MLCRLDSASFDKRKRRFINSVVWNKLSPFRKQVRSAGEKVSCGEILKIPFPFLVFFSPSSLHPAEDLDEV